MTEIEVCPHCNSSGLMRNATSGMNKPDGTVKGKWQCRECYKFCDTPETREPKAHKNGGSTLASKLRKADPEEWP